MSGRRSKENGTLRRNKDRVVIAIDGPSGVGKSTVARLLAERLGYLYVDTGAMYRAVALKAKEAALDLKDERGLEQLCRSIEIEFRQDESGLRVLCDGEDVTEDIRRPSTSLLASAISRVGAVRKALLRLQRGFGQKGGVVLEGRDIGTVVFPRATLKFFLGADSHVRGLRRYNELKAKGERVDLDETVRELDKRDTDDSTRALAPLRKAEDAVFIDTSQLTAEDVVEKMIQIYQERVERVKKPRRDK